MEPIVRLAYIRTKSIGTCSSSKTIGHPLDASVTVYAEGAAFDALNALGEEGLAKLVIVSEAHIVNGAAPAEAVKDEETGVATVVAPSELEKCERCWIHRDTVGQDSEPPYHYAIVVRGVKAL